MLDKSEELIRQMHQREIERIRQDSPLPLAPLERPTIHWTELREISPDSPIAKEWSVYRREIGRLLAEGHEGKWVLIKGEQIIDIYETFHRAYEVALERFLMQSVLIQQVRSREPILRVRGYNLPCRS
jgi:hypothetical protein